MRSIISLCIYFLFCAFSAKAQENKDTIQNTADIYWKTKPKYNDQLYSRIKSDNSKSTKGSDKEINNLLNQEQNQDYLNQLKLVEINRRVLTDWLVNFCKLFPDDPRTFELLRSFHPSFFVNIDEGAQATLERRYIIAIDKKAKNELDSTFAVVRKKFLNSDKADNEKIDFLYRELSIPSQYWRANYSEKYNIKNWIEKVLNFAEKYKNTPIVSKWLELIVREADKLFTGGVNNNQYGLDQLDLVSLIDTLKKSGVIPFQHYALQKERMMALRKEPFSLKTKTVYGKSFDISKLKGKLIFIDMWNVTCSTCIAKMPIIKKVYDDYKQKGFEVVSICFSIREDENQERKKLKTIQRKINAEWPTIYLSTKPGKLGADIQKKYSFYGVPQLLLLDEEGRLLCYNGQLNERNGLEKLVKQYLGDRTIQNKGTY